MTKLILLGTAGFHPNERRHTACLMLPELGIVLDAGTAMFRVRDHLCTSRLDIFLSHAHLDHVVGLTFLLDVLYGKQIDPVTLYGAAEKLAAIDRHLLAKEIFPVALPCNYEALTGPVELPGGPRVTHFPLSHPGGTLGFRLSWPDRAMAYVTDTTASADAEYLEQIRGVDLLVHECNFPDSMSELAAVTGHSCLTPVLELARAANVKRLVLTHLNPLADSDEFLGLEQARHIFPAVETGWDGMEIEF